MIMMIYEEQYIFYICSEAGNTHGHDADCFKIWFLQNSFLLK